MDDLLKQLPDLTREFFNYGPYALAALFLLFLAPKHTKRFIDSQQQDPVKRNLLCGIAIGNWLVAFLMCFYIYSNWSPTKAYQGSLGVHNEDSSFLTVDPNSYIATKEIDDNHIEWIFAFISPNGVIKKDDQFKFFHHFKEQVTSYSIDADLLKSGKITLRASKEDPSKLILNGSNEILEPIASFRLPKHETSFMAAYADTDDTAAIIKNLLSSNKHFQDIGRRKLYSKSTTELQQMLQTPNLPEKARIEIENVIKRR